MLFSTDMIKSSLRDTYIHNNKKSIDNIDSIYTESLNTILEENKSLYSYLSNILSYNTIDPSYLKNSYNSLILSYNYIMEYLFSYSSNVINNVWDRYKLYYDSFFNNEKDNLNNHKKELINYTGDKLSLVSSIKVYINYKPDKKYNDLKSELSNLNRNLLDIINRLKSCRTASERSKLIKKYKEEIKVNSVDKYDYNIKSQIISSAPSNNFGDDLYNYYGRYNMVYCDSDKIKEIADEYFYHNINDMEKEKDSYIKIMESNLKSFSIKNPDLIIDYIPSYDAFTNNKTIIFINDIFLDTISRTRILINDYLQFFASKLDANIDCYKDYKTILNAAIFKCWYSKEIKKRRV